jgi:hypothetical protein
MNRIAAIVTAGVTAGLSLAALGAMAASQGVLDFGSSDNATVAPVGNIGNDLPADAMVAASYDDRDDDKYEKHEKHEKEHDEHEEHDDDD